MIGGRARGRQRPRAPSLTERPSGHRRAFSIRGVEREATGTLAGAGDKDKGPEGENNRDADEGLKRRNKTETSAEDFQTE